VGTASSSAPSLPAATTKSVFAAAAMASRSAFEKRSPPSEALTTRAPLRAA
jgi:hypothetical protein